MPTEDKQTTGWQNLLSVGMIATASAIPMQQGLGNYYRFNPKSVLDIEVEENSGSKTLEYYHEIIDSSSSGIPVAETIQSQKAIEKTIADFFDELITDFTAVEETILPHQVSSKLIDDDVDEHSFNNAIRFLLAVPEDFPAPSYDVHPDGEMSFFWRKDDIGILSLSFTNDENLNYASFFVKDNSKHKGKISLNSFSSRDRQNDKTPAESSFLYSLIKKFA